MLTSLGYIFIFGLFAAFVFRKIGLPSLVGMLLVGIVLGPYGANLLEEPLLNISADLRKAALVIILFRVGLALDLVDLKAIGRPAFLMSFMPACFEIAGVMILAPLFFDISLLDAVILGSVIAAVSPAVIVPRMLSLMKEGYGRDKKIPQLIMAGGSLDDIFVILVFTSCIALECGEKLSIMSFVNVPISILLGIASGIVIGLALVKFFKKFHMRDSLKVLIMLGISFLLLKLENIEVVPFSGLLSIVCIGITILKKYEVLAKRISEKFTKLWLGAEILLFVLVGATVDVKYAMSAGIIIILFVMLVALFRMLGVATSLIKTPLNKKERLFCMLAYLPKATVQAAIGSIPLALNLPCGNLVLSVAVISILLTAPIGAIAIDLSHKKLLNK